MSWQAGLLANMEGKQTQYSFNHAYCQSVFFGAGTRSETLGDPQTQP